MASGSSATVRSLDCVVYINGKIFGVVNAASWDINTGRKILRTVDRLTPSELIATRSEVSGNMEIFKKHQDGGIEGVGMTPIQSQLPAERYFFLQILDATTDTMLLQVPKAAVGKQTWRVAAKDVLHGTFDFSGITYDSDF